MFSFLFVILAFLFEFLGFVSTFCLVSSLLLVDLDEQKFFIVISLGSLTGFEEPEPVIDGWRSFEEFSDLFVFESVSILIFLNVAELEEELIDSGENHEFGFDGVVGDFDVAVFGFEGVLNNAVIRKGFTC